MSGKANSSPIVTLTPAPTLDRTYFVTNLHSGAVNRADDVREELAGKGINVSRGLHLANISAPGIVRQCRPRRFSSHRISRVSNSAMGRRLTASINHNS